MFLSCFSNPTSASRNSSQMPQSLITCIYQTTLCNSPTYITLTWSKTHFSHSLTIYAPDFISITISLYSSLFPFFRARPGSKSVYLNQSKRSQKMKLYWDFTKAELNQNSAEPESGFYIAVTSKSKVEFFLGDKRRIGSGFNFTPSSGVSTLMSRREHVFGYRNFITKAEFLGSKHEICIECSNGVLKVKIDRETRLVVKKLSWKFRGKEKIMIDGIEVEFYWDVFNWINKSQMQKNGNGHGVFVFQIGDTAGIWPEIVGAEKKLMKRNSSSAGGTPAMMMMSPSSSMTSSSSVLQWAEESSDCGSSSCSSTRSCGSVGGFSLLLYAWRKDHTSQIKPI